jgi:hypothetical protein
MERSKWKEEGRYRLLFSSLSIDRKANRVVRRLGWWWSSSNLQHIQILYVGSVIKKTPGENAYSTCKALSMLRQDILGFEEDKSKIPLDHRSVHQQLAQ